MWKHRAGYLLLVLVNGVLFYLFGLPVLGLTLGMFVLMALLMAAGLAVDSRGLSVSCRALRGGEAGKPMEFAIQVDSRGKMIFLREILVDVAAKNAMTGRVTHAAFLLPIRRNTREYVYTKVPTECGELRISCEGIHIHDHLRLFSRKVQPFAPFPCMVYPPRERLEVELSRQSVGSPRDDGAVQNRMGTDSSETFDIREYTPGDDIRGIHWKLSVKTDSLILRQPSAPSFYDLAVLPDFGMMSEERETTAQERNAAIAYGAAALEQLVRRGISCCLVLCGGAELQTYPVRSRRDYEDALSAWMCTPLPKCSGDAMHLFLTQRLYGRFTRLLVLNAGKFNRRQEAHGSELAVTVLSTVDGLEASGRAVQNGNIAYVELPTKPERDDCYRLSC